MNDEKRHFEKDLGEVMRPEFSQDLKALFGPDSNVPGRVDRAVAGAARNHLTRPARKLWWLKWTVPATAAAAIALVCVLWNGQKPASYPVAEMSTAVSPGDIDHNGKVDILDAFKLARHVESAPSMDQTWDINGDGAVDHLDVDAVAFAAVRLDKGV